MFTQPFALEDWMMVAFATLCAVLICIFVIQAKRLGRPDERSSRIRAEMLAATFISLLVSVPLVSVLVPVNYKVLIAVAFSLLVGILFQKITRKRQIL
ncbi:MAG TPA: hypothetical protein VFZ58_01810 [Candidatus Saccharimonadales bacterium]